MEKIMEITQEQLDNLKNADNQVEVFKEITNIEEIGEYCIGDSTIKVDNSKKIEVYKELHNNKNFYYIIVNTIDAELAFVYSLYPKN